VPLLRSPDFRLRPADPWLLSSEVYADRNVGEDRMLISVRIRRPSSSFVDPGRLDADAETDANVRKVADRMVTTDASSLWAIAASFTLAISLD
jgi:hypothetical protein